MRLLITGAFGYLGGRLTEWLRGRGHSVVLGAFMTPAWATAWSRPYEVRPLDVLNRAQADAAVDGIDAVVHLAALDENEAMRDPALALAVSRVGTQHLAEACARTGARLVFFSTFHVYGPGAPPIIDEETRPQPTHPYALAHLAGEEACRGGAIILRPTNGYGAPIAREVDRFTLAHNDFCRQAVTDGKIVLKTSGEQLRDFVWCDDIAQAVELTLPQGNAVYNVGSGGARSIVSLAERVQARAQAVLGRPIPIERGAATGKVAPLEVRIDRVRALGYRPTDAIDREADRLLALLQR